MYNSTKLLKAIRHINKHDVFDGNVELTMGDDMSEVEVMLKISSGCHEGAL